MPTYEYACTVCDVHVEVVQRMTEGPLTTCGVCGGRLRKVFHPAGILFKGSGFYSTDNRSKSKSATADKPAESSKKAEASGKKESAASSEVSTSKDTGSKTASKEKSA